MQIPNFIILDVLLASTNNCTYSIYSNIAFDRVLLIL